MSGAEAPSVAHSRPKGQARLWKLPLHQLRELAESDAPIAAPRRERITAVRQRSEAVRAYVLRRADGNCEGCGEKAPFLTSDGKPYLEPHHARRLADGGPDHPRWVIALCPNCHAHVHYGADGDQFNAKLIADLAVLEPD